MLQIECNTINFTMTWWIFRCSTLSLSNMGNLTNCNMRSGLDHYSYVLFRALISFGWNYRHIKKKHVFFYSTPTRRDKLKYSHQFYFVLSQDYSEQIPLWPLLSISINHEIGLDFHQIQIQKYTHCKENRQKYKIPLWSLSISIYHEISLDFHPLCR